MYLITWITILIYRPLRYDVQYVAVVVSCELGVEDRSFVRLLKVEEGDCRVRDSGFDKCC